MTCCAVAKDGSIVSGDRAGRVYILTLEEKAVPLADRGYKPRSAAGLSSQRAPWRM
jgi:hypothetical protein